MHKGRRLAHRNEIKIDAVSGQELSFRSLINVSRRHARSFGHAPSAVPLVSVLPAHEIALKRLNYGVGIPFWPVGVS